MADNIDEPWLEPGLTTQERALKLWAHISMTCWEVGAIERACNAAVRAALADAVPKWISTKDAMPIVGNNVLALWSQSGTCERIYERCYVDEWGFWRYSRTGEQIWNNSVSHWQYVTVPEPPKDTPPCE